LLLTGCFQIDTPLPFFSCWVLGLFFCFGGLGVSLCSHYGTQKIFPLSHFLTFRRSFCFLVLVTTFFGPSLFPFLYEANAFLTPPRQGPLSVSPFCFQIFPPPESVPTRFEKRCPLSLATRWPPLFSSDLVKGRFFKPRILLSFSFF